MKSKRTDPDVAILAVFSTFIIAIDLHTVKRSIQNSILLQSGE